MMQAAARAGRDAAARAGRPAPLLIAVTVLTSMDDDDAARDGRAAAAARSGRGAGEDDAATPDSTASWHRRRKRRRSGRRAAPTSRSSRRASAARRQAPTRNDQTRTMGPAEAVQAGASYIVVGRPIIAAANPRAAAEAIVEELETGSGIRDRDPLIGTVEPRQVPGPGSRIPIRLLRRNDERAAAIARPARFGLLGADRRLLALAD